MILIVYHWGTTDKKGFLMIREFYLMRETAMVQKTLNIDEFGTMTFRASQSMNS
jgi:hypothetical protein